MQFSEQIRATINQGQAEAVRLGNDFIGTEHLLLGLMQSNNGAIIWLRKLNVDIDQLRNAAESMVRGKMIRKGLTPAIADSLPLSDQAERVILGTIREAKIRKSSRVEAHDLFVSIVRNSNSLDLLDPYREQV